MLCTGEAHLKIDVVAEANANLLVLMRLTVPDQIKQDSEQLIWRVRTHVRESELFRTFETS